MINSVIFDDEIKIWWEYHHLKKGELFRVIKDEEIFFTCKSHYCFQGLEPEQIVCFSVDIVNAEGEVVEKVGTYSARTFPKKKDIDVTKAPYNAVGDGKTLNTQAIQAALNDCKEDERVYIPSGIFLTGALDMKSDTELYLADDAVLQGTDNPEDYLPKVKSRFEGAEELCYRSLINTGVMDSAANCGTENIMLRGGTILGGGAPLRENIIQRERLEILKAHGMENEASPPSYYACTLPGRTRGRLLCCNNTRNIVIANMTVGDSASWNLHFIYSENIITCSCKIQSHKIPNGDGWDPDSSKNCVLFDVEFDTGDDCVAIKSGKNLEGYEIGRPSENIYIFDCYAKEGHGIAIGSEMSGGIRDIYIWNCDIRYGTGFSIKTHKIRGGYIDNVRVYNCNLPTLFVGVYDGNNGGDPAPTEPTVSNLYFEDVTVNGLHVLTNNTERVVSENAVNISGYSKENSVKNVTVKNLTIKHRQLLSYQMLSFHNVENLHLENIVCKGEL